MSHSSRFHAARLGCLLCVAALLLPAGCVLWPKKIHPEFVNTFMEIYRHSDDRATTVAFDAARKVLAVGRESGRLELWDASTPDTQVMLEAHSQRVADLTFGTAEGIVISSSEIDGRSRIWDMRSGELVHELEGACGPAALSSIPGVYVVSHTDRLRLYHHARRSLIGESVKIDGTITSVAASSASGLVAVGTSIGSLHLFALEKSGDSLTLSPLRESRPYESGNWIQAVSLREGGTHLVSVTRHGEVASWDTATLERRRVIPITLQHVGWASFTPGEPWLVLAGTLDPQGMRHGKIELVDLRRGIALRYKANTNLPVAVLLPEISAGLVLQSGSVRRIRYVDP